MQLDVKIPYRPTMYMMVEMGNATAMLCDRKIHNNNDKHVQWIIMKTSNIF